MSNQQKPTQMQPQIDVTHVCRTQNLCRRQFSASQTNMTSNLNDTIAKFTYNKMAI